MPKTKRPTLYYNPEDTREISFAKLPGYKRVTEKSPAVFTAYLLSNDQQTLGAALAIEACRDTYCIAWDSLARAVAYTDRNMEGQNWEDLRKQ